MFARMSNAFRTAAFSNARRLSARSASTAESKAAAGGSEGLDWEGAKQLGGFIFLMGMLGFGVYGANRAQRLKKKEEKAHAHDQHAHKASTAPIAQPKPMAKPTAKPIAKPEPHWSSDRADDMGRQDTVDRAYRASLSTGSYGMPGSTGLSGSMDQSGWIGSSAYSGDLGIPRVSPAPGAHSTLGASVGAGGRMYLPRRSPLSRPMPMPEMAGASVGAVPAVRPMESRASAARTDK